MRARYSLFFWFLFFALASMAQSINPVGDSLSASLSYFTTELEHVENSRYSIIGNTYDDYPTINYPARAIELNFNDSLIPFFSNIINSNKPEYQSFLYQNRKEFSETWVNHHVFIPIIDSIGKQYSVPKSAPYLIYTQSMLRKKHSKKNGDKGWWSMSYLTALKHQLQIKSFIDERYDLVKSTHAAFSHMIGLYHIYKNWDLVYMAFTFGPEELNKTIALHGSDIYEADYYSLLTFDQKEIISFSIFLGTLFEHIPLNDPLVYLSPDDYTKQPLLKSVYLDQIAYFYDEDLELLKELNPTYKEGIIPALSDTTYITLPKHLADSLSIHLDSIIAFRHSQYFPDNYRNFFPLGDPTKSDYPGRRLVYYKVRKGDYLGRIARKYKVSVRDIQKWNRLRGTKIREGQRLKIYVR